MGFGVCSVNFSERNGGSSPRKVSSSGYGAVPHVDWTRGARPPRGRDYPGLTRKLSPIADAEAAVGPDCDRIAGIRDGDGHVGRRVISMPGAEQLVEGVAVYNSLEGWHRFWRSFQAFCQRENYPDTGLACTHVRLDISVVWEGRIRDVLRGLSLTSGKWVSPHGPSQYSRGAGRSCRIESTCWDFVGRRLRSRHCRFGDRRSVCLSGGRRELSGQSLFGSGRLNTRERSTHRGCVVTYLYAPPKWWLVYSRCTLLLCQSSTNSERLCISVLPGCYPGSYHVGQMFSTIHRTNLCAWPGITSGHDVKLTNNWPH